MGRIVSLTRLSENRTREVKELERVCREHDHTSGEMMVSGEYNYSRSLKCFFLFYEGRELTGFLYIFSSIGTVGEISAIVRPDRRRNGIFTVLLAEAEKELRSAGIRKKLFIAEPVSDAAAAVAKKLRRKLKYTELLMKYDPEAGAGLNKAEESGVICRDASFEGSSELRLLFINENGEEFGSSGVLLNGSTAFIFDVKVYEDYRGKGNGKRLVGALLAHLEKNYPGYEISLHVTDTNSAAEHIYRKAGFVTVEARNYY